MKLPRDRKPACFRLTETKSPSCGGKKATALKPIKSAWSFFRLKIQSNKPDDKMTFPIFKKCSFWLGGLAIAANFSIGAAEFSQVPGVVIDHLPASSGLYVGSPSLVVWTNGDYIASHDFFGPKSTEHTLAVTAVFRSHDRGATWQKTATLHGQFWSTLFVNHGALYLIGPDKEYGDIVIRRSLDGGTTWSTPTDATTGRLRDGEYHTAPTPVIEHDRRLWRAFEQRNPPTGWGINFRAGMLSAPMNADLLAATNWTASNFLPRDPHWLDDKFNAWLEGNAVVAPGGNIVDILRVDQPNLPEKAAIVEISADGRTASFNPQNGFVDFPGGAKKFTIRHDAKSGLYWSLVNYIPPKNRSAGHPASIRNTLALAASPDLVNWTVRAILLTHPDVKKHGFQYVDWQFDGDDIIAVSRTAFDDGLDGANSYHNANYLTFHRWKNFRNLKTLDTRATNVVPASAFTNHASWRDGKPVALPDVTRPAVESAFVFRPTNTWTYSHHAELTFFKGRYFASWSNGRKNEDAPGQRVLFSTSMDFTNWTAPRPLVDSVTDTNSVERVLTAAGFYAHDGTLVAYFGNYGPHKETTRLEAVTTTDGEHWNAAREIGLPVNPNYGPQRTASGRLIISGNISFPWSDDPTGLAGWHMSGIYSADMGAEIKDDPASFWGVAKRQGWPTALCEGSFFQADNGVIYMFLRATGANATSRLWLTDSSDNGVTWSAPAPTGFSNCDAKFQLDRLPDGRFFYLGNPLAGNRTPLVLSLSKDGVNFDRHFILGDDHYEMRYPGRAKGGEYGYPHALIHDGFLNVIISRQKESVQVLRVKLADLK
jgi:hypothetical protein